MTPSADAPMATTPATAPTSTDLRSAWSIGSKLDDDVAARPRDGMATSPEIAAAANKPPLGRMVLRFNFTTAYSLPRRDCGHTPPINLKFELPARLEFELPTSQMRNWRACWSNSQTARLNVSGNATTMQRTRMSDESPVANCE